MKQNNTLSLLKLEFFHVLGGIFTPLFGILMPTGMAVLMSTVFTVQVPAEYLSEAITSLTLTMAAMIPLAIMLVSFPSTYSQDVEQNIIFRMQLFQVSEKKLLFVKIIVNFAIMTASLLVYGLVMYLYKGEYLIMPNMQSLIIYLVTLYALATVYFLLSFSVANISKKFGVTYAFAMTCYFATMIFSGMMGMDPSQFPSGILQTITHYMPISFIYTDFYTYWTTGFAGYNFAPFMQAMIFWAALAGIAFFVNLYVNRKRV